MPASHSPLKEKPLRIPGQSLDEEINRVENDEVGTYAGIAVIALALDLYVWFLTVTHSSLHPLGVTIVCAAYFIYSMYRIRKAKAKIANLKLGRDGERIVAESLDTLREEGAVIFHDILSDEFNIDHTVLARQGIYVVETKTWSKYSDSKVVYDGKTLLVNGKSPDRDPIVQVVALSNWLRAELQKSTGKRFPVHPVVVFPGWYVETLDSARSGPVWVLNPKALPSFIQHERTKISEEDLRLAAYHLARLVRSKI